jgi:hypothetical protein
VVFPFSSYVSVVMWRRVAVVFPFFLESRILQRPDEKATKLMTSEQLICWQFPIIVVQCLVYVIGIKRI